MKKDRKTKYFPLFLNVEGKKCLVVGGGQVALRKVKVLLEHGADVEVISPDLCAELVRLADGGAIRAFCHEYREGDLANTLVTIAATDNEDTNRRVAAEARRRAVLVNVVDDAENSDFIFPSYLRRGDVTIAVSTAGRSPALARKLRTRLEETFGDEYASLALLIDEVRSEVKKQGIKVDGDTWQEALDTDLLLSLLKKGEREKAKASLLSNLKTKHLS
ncbi:MAG: bifunctional precorrin-2 dehydrogenase/sirohydrochlorin ferrochelatase [Dehalococcoidales bacterium]|nr:bifunctional precorrin-2 dehydrogenase/sirohydrochlorin ferrochelatase [Dehalococcoidales bacterium]